MSGDDVARVIYLTLLACVIGGYFFMSQRRNLGQTARHAALWGLIFLGVVAGYGLWNDVSRDLMPGMSITRDGRQVKLPLGQDGRFYMTLEIENTPITFVVDRSSPDILLSLQDAERVGIDIESLFFDGRASPTSDRVRTARVNFSEVRLGDMSEGPLSASVSQAPLDNSLLGNIYLSRFSEVEVRDNWMYLTR